jgi:Domain of unknown function (DUF4062)
MTLTNKLVFNSQLIPALNFIEVRTTMSRSESVLTVFLASPGDLVEERNRLEEIIVEWNRAWARNLGLRLELLMWEHDAYPGAGMDPQDVINRQLPNDYDLFIGLMWTRYGTPTTRAGSGTAEEFERALVRFKTFPDDVSLFFYFKDVPIPPSKIDPIQLQAIQNFKKSLGTEGVLYWAFSETDQFEKLVTLHITKHVQNWQQKQQHAQIKKPMRMALPDTAAINLQPATSEIEADDPDQGYLDFLEVFSERSSEVIDIVTRLAAAQNELTGITAHGTSELQALSNSPNGTTPSQVRRLVSKVADEMSRFTNRVNAEIPLFRAAMDGSINALVRAAILSVEFSLDESLAARSVASQLLTALSGARHAMVDFKITTSAYPRMTKDLNVAKRKQVAALDELVGQFENAERLLAESVTMIDSLLRDSKSSL